MPELPFPRKREAQEEENAGPLQYPWARPLLQSNGNRGRARRSPDFTTMGTLSPVGAASGTYTLIWNAPAT
jgi:hypothetical protein